MDKMEHMNFEEFRKAAAAKLDELDALAKELREERTKPISQQLAEGMQKVKEEMIHGKPFNKEGKPVTVMMTDFNGSPSNMDEHRVSLSGKEGKPVEVNFDIHPALLKAQEKGKKLFVKQGSQSLTKENVDDIVTVLQAFSSLPLGEQYGLLAGSGIDAHDEDIQYLEGKLRAILKDM